MTTPAADFTLAMPETDPSRIVHWSDVDAPDMSDIYFKQRLGPKFKDAPAVLISREGLIKLTRGEDALLGEMIQREPDAMADLWMSFARGPDHGVVMGFNIESQTPGARVIRFIEENKRSESHNEWLRRLREVQRSCGALHLQWKQMEMRQGFEFHRIIIPSARKVVAAVEEEAVA